jgi:hypothetical protein
MGPATHAWPVHDSDAFYHRDATQGTIRVPWIASRWNLIADDVVVKPISLNDPEVARFPGPVEPRLSIYQDPSTRASAEVIPAEDDVSCISRKWRDAPPE